MIAALFNVALAVCPPGFRREYGASIRRDFARASAEERDAGGPLAAIRYALEATSDLFLTALREYASMLGRDLAFALRSLRKTPSFSAVVIATLALAIGANAAVFSIMHAVVLAPLPYADADRLVFVEPSQRGLRFDSSLPDFADLMRADEALYESGAAFAMDHVTLSGSGTPEREAHVITTPRLFETLGMRPELGRFGTEADTAKGAPKTAVISDGLWRSRFGADPHILGSVAKLDGVPYEIVGVAPAGFQQPDPPGGFPTADLWTFVAEDGRGTDYAQRGYHTFTVVARLSAGTTIEHAGAAASVVVANLRRRYPDDDTVLSMSVRSLDDGLLGKVRPVIFALFAAVGAVLLVACANVANLLLSRAAGREREFSVRIAVGASRGRIIMQLLVEAFALSVAGGVLGIGLAYGIVAVFARLRLPSIPRAELVTVDVSSIAFTLGVVAFCTFAAGIIPGLATSSRDVATALKSAGRGGDGSRGARTRSALVAAEIAVALALVVAAGLVVRSYVALTSQPLGFDPDRVAIVGPIEIPNVQVPNEATSVAMMDRILRAVRAVPGVREAAWGFNAPFTRNAISSSVDIEGQTYPKGLMPDSQLAPVSSGFFATLHVPLRDGRFILATDRAGTLPVVVVNEAFARKFYPNTTAVGKRLTPQLSFSGKPQRRTIAGVIGDLRTTFGKPAEPIIYLPEPQYAFTSSSLVVRTDGDVSEAIARTILATDPILARPESVTLSSLLARDVAQQRLTVASLCALGFIALALSLAGVFAVMSNGVTQRTHEFGVRMALGADARRIVRTVLGGAIRLSVAGVVFGLLLAGAGTRLLADQLYDTEPLDPAVFGSVAALVIVSALVAAIVPARRATRVDPIVALRYE